jgi:phospholipid transport system substrate-binding protein
MKLLVFLPFLIPVAAAAPAAAQAKPEHAAAVQVVQRFDDAMLDILKNSAELDYKARYERFKPSLEATFDLPFMAEKAIGSHWEKLGEDERRRWVSAFTAFMAANYASRLNKYTGQTFEIVGSETAANDTAIIQTKVIDPGNENVDLSYRMRTGDNGWRIIDIYYNGTVSELALRRADYAAVLKKDGFEALLASVNRKIADLENGKTA